MDRERRGFIAAAGVLGAGLVLPSAPPVAAAARVIDGADLPAIERKRHEHYMRLALAEARRNPGHPFGAVIVHTRSGEVLGRGVNDQAHNPTYHGEIVAINDYVASHGSRDWDAVSLYTTGEPCPMCMGALVWAGVREVIWATSIAGIRAAGFGQIDITAAEVAGRASSFYRPLALIGGVLAEEADKLFAAAPAAPSG